MAVYCSKCGKKLGILAAKYKLKDDVVLCSSCLKKIKEKLRLKKREEEIKKQEELKIKEELRKREVKELKKLGVERYIAKYLANKTNDFDIYFVEIFDAFQVSKKRVKQVSQGKEFVDESKVYKDVEWRQLTKEKIEFLKDLKNIHDLIKEAGTEADYFKILSIIWKVRKINRRVINRRKQEEWQRKHIEKLELERKRRERWEIEIGLSKNFSHYTPTEFEKFIGELFKKMGYELELTPPTKDYGVDLVAKKYGKTIAIQVKKYTKGNMVGAQVVQQTLGAMWKVKADQSILITTSGFTVYAAEQAKGAPIELWDNRILDELVRKYMIGDIVTSCELCGKVADLQEIIIGNRRIMVCDECRGDKNG